MIEDKVILLAKVQAADDTAEALTAAEYVHIIPSKTGIDIVPTMGEIEEVGPNFENGKKVLLTTNTNIKAAQYLYSLGDATKPDFMVMLEGAGYGVVTNNVAAGKNTFVATPGVVSKSLSLEHYQIAASGDAIKRNAHNVILLPKFIFDGSNVPTVEYSGVGCYGGKEKVLAAAIPAVTRRTVSPRGFYGVSMSFMSPIANFSYKSSKIEFDPAVTAEQMIDWEQTSGFGASEMTGLKSKLTTTVYANLDNADPEAVLQAGTTGSITFDWGATGNKIRFAFTTCQIVKATPSKIGKFEAYDLEIDVIGNAHTITANYGLTA